MPYHGNIEGKLMANAKARQQLKEDSNMSQVIRKGGCFGGVADVGMGKTTEILLLDLDPCPVPECGGKADYLASGPVLRAVTGKKKGYVYCTECGKRGAEGTPEEAATMWNAVARITKGTHQAIDMELAVKTRRLGKFLIAQHAVRKEPKRVHLLLRQVLIVSAKAEFATDSIEYTAFCSIFKPVKEAMAIPLYMLSLDKDGGVWAI